MYTENKKKTKLFERKKKYILYSHVALVLHSPSLLPFFSVLCQWLMNSYEKQEFVFFLRKEKNKSFLFSCHEK